MIRNFKILCSSSNYKILLGLFLCLILAAVIELIGIGSVPVFVMLILDAGAVQSKIPNFINLDFINQLDTSDLVFFGAIVLTIIFFIKNIYLAIVLYFEGFVYKILRINLSSRLFRLYTEADYSFHLKTNPATLLRNIEGEASRAISVIQSYIYLVREILVLLVIFTLLIIVDPVISFAAFLFLSLFVGIYYFFTNQKLHRYGKIFQSVRAEQIKHINHSFGVIKAVKILNKENFLYKIFLRNISIFEKALLSNYFLSSLPKLFLEMIVMSTIVLIVTIFIYLDRDVVNMIPLLSLLVVAAIRLMPSFNSISRSLARIRNLSPSSNLIAEEIIKLEKLSLNQNKNLIDKINFSKEIKFFDLKFKYENADVVAINNFNATIRVGEKIGIIGSSGAGKSTLLDLFLGLLKPSAGRIEVNSTNIEKNIKSWQSLIGYVPQDIYLLDESIKNNIAFGIPEEIVDSKNLQKAIQLSQLENFINDLPNGVNTIVGNRGVRISGGQRQRIGIARALYINQKILVFDEATNSLDLENEKKIVDNVFLFDKSKTLILISHRHETVKDCDQIFLMKEGHLLDHGKYDYLDNKYNLSTFIEKKKLKKI
jgi:ATP-binding cassette, subfamily B, bacterial PglK